MQGDDVLEADGIPPAPAVRGPAFTGTKPSYDSGAAAGAITREGLRWDASSDGSTTVTYAFRSSGSVPAGYSGFSRFNATQITVAERALAAWSDVANVNFQRVGSGTSGEAAYSNAATILFGDFGGGAYDVAAFAYYPGDPGWGSPSGDVWVDIRDSYNVAPSVGNYGAEVLLHELGHTIGLSHPSDYDAEGSQAITYAADASYREDSRQYSVMSYFSEGETGAYFGGYYAASPMIDDIAAIQRLYGARTARTGDTTYGFNSTAGPDWYVATTARAPIFSVWDSGGNDTLDFSGYAAAQRIDLRAGQFSDVGGLRGNVSIAYGVTIENAVGGSGGDTIVGNDADNMLTGNGGDDTIYGGAGNDRLYGGDGNDVLEPGTGVDFVDGGAGIDTARFEGKASDYTIVDRGDGSYELIGNGADATVVNVENFVFGTATPVAAGAVQKQAIDGLRYIASYPDLIRAFGADAAAGLAHYRQYGRAEGRTVTFDPYAYAATNPDVARAFGSDKAAIERHYIQYGYREGRATSGFNAYIYGASNPDVAHALGADTQALYRHYIDYGLREGRATSGFDPYAYAIANPDARLRAGADPTRLTSDYLNGAVTNDHLATTTGFSPLRYAASNPDLLKAFGLDARALEKHYVQYGLAEGRDPTSFSPIAYALANPDVRAAFGFDQTALAKHYIQYGYAEHRNTGGSFDPLRYAASNPDIARAFGTDIAAITNHYLTYGIAEHRVSDSFDPAIYLSTYGDLQSAYGTDLDAATRHFISYGLNEGRQPSTYDAVAYMLSHPAAAGHGLHTAALQYLAEPATAARLGPYGTDQTTMVEIPTTGRASIGWGFNGGHDQDLMHLRLDHAASADFTLTPDIPIDSALTLYDANGTRIGSAAGHDTATHLTQTLAAGDYYLSLAQTDDSYIRQIRLDTVFTAVPHASAAAIDLHADLTPPPVQHLYDMI